MARRYFVTSLLVLAGAACGGGGSSHTQATAPMSIPIVTTAQTMPAVTVAQLPPALVARYKLWMRNAANAGKLKSATVFNLAEVSESPSIARYRVAAGVVYVDAGPIGTAIHPRGLAFSTSCKALNEWQTETRFTGASGCLA